VLVGRDRDRGASRSFRLSRIEGAVRTVGEPGSFTAPTAEELAEALQTWGSGPERLATLAVLPERASAARARAVAAPADEPARTLANRDIVHVPFRAEWELAEELVGYGDAVVVLAPPGLRASVLHLLQTAATLDEEVAGDG
jgi:proteasome accessory factor B